MVEESFGQRITRELLKDMEEEYLRRHSFSQFPPKDEIKIPLDQSVAALVLHPSVVLILGHRGMGKTALACRIQELMNDKAPVYAVGLPHKARRLLPDWYGLAAHPLEVPPNAIIYIPESYRMFHARDTQSAQGRLVGDLVNLSRHRRHTLIFDVQNPAHLDRNIISEADVIFVKEPGPFTQGFDRPQLRPIMDSARAAFAGVGPLRKKRAIWVVVPAQGIQGRLMENQRPSFWTDALSRVFSESSLHSSVQGEVSEGPGPRLKLKPRAMRKGKRTEAHIRQDKAKQLRAAGYSYQEIGKILGVSKSHAFRLVNY